MRTQILNPRQAVTVDTSKGDDTLSITNNHETGDATYTISMDGGKPQQHTLGPGMNDDYDLTGHARATVKNTGPLSLEVDLE